MKRFIAFCIHGSIALCVVLLATAQLVAFDCNGDGTCNVDISGFDTDCATSLGIDWTENCRTGKAIVSYIDYKELQAAGCFDMTLDPDKNSSITVTGCNANDELFPATVQVEINGVIDLNGAELRADTPLVLKSEGTIESWPPADDVFYYVAEDITYVGENPDDYVTIRAGSTIQVSP